MNSTREILSEDKQSIYFTRELTSDVSRHFTKLQIIRADVNKKDIEDEFEILFEMNKYSSETVDSIPKDGDIYSVPWHKGRLESSIELEKIENDELYFVVTDVAKYFLNTQITKMVFENNNETDKAFYMRYLEKNGFDNETRALTKRPATKVKTKYNLNLLTRHLKHM